MHYIKTNKKKQYATESRNTAYKKTYSQSHFESFSSIKVFFCVSLLQK